MFHSFLFCTSSNPTWAITVIASSPSVLIPTAICFSVCLCSPLSALPLVKTRPLRLLLLQDSVYLQRVLCIRHASVNVQTDHEWTCNGKILSCHTSLLSLLTSRSEGAGEILSCIPGKLQHDPGMSLQVLSISLAVLGAILAAESCRTTR